LRDFLFGTPGGTISYSEEVPASTYFVNRSGNRVGANNRARVEGMTDAERQAAGITSRTDAATTRWKTMKRPGGPGFLKLAGRMSKELDAVEGQSRSRFVKSVRQSDSANTRMMDSLTSQASADVARGGAMDPVQQRLAEQAVRGRLQGSLADTGDLGAFNEAIGMSAYSQNLKQQRFDNASRLGGLRHAMYAGGYQSQNPLGNAAQVLGLTRGSGPQLFGSNINANDVYSSNANNAAASRATAANNNAALAGAGLSAAALLASAFI
jgi:hypothetical protein